MNFQAEFRSDLVLLTVSCLFLDRQLASDVQPTDPNLASAGNFDSVDLPGRHILAFYSLWNIPFYSCVLSCLSIE